MATNLTAEQAAIVTAIGREDRPTVKVQAGAGCGKSFTLKQAALAQPNRRFVYTAFNAPLVRDAKKSMPANVRCTTVHGLAFGRTGVPFKARMDSARYVPAREAAEILSLVSGFQPGKMAPIIHPTTLARLTLRMVNKFMASADRQIGTVHLTGYLEHDGYQPEEALALAEHLLPYAERAWADLQKTTGGRLRFEHAVYLKLFQLEGGQIKADCLMVDEAQDLSPVMCSIFYQQRNTQIVLVGDSAQAINGFTGAVDALEKFPAQVELTLTQSFRFGQGVADEANRWLRLLRAPIRLTGRPDLTSAMVESIELPDAILTRSNAGAITAVMHQLEAGRKVALVGGGDQITKLAKAAIDLKAGQGTDHPELMAFQTWDQLVEFAQDDNADAQLQTFVKLIEDNGAEKMLEMAGRLVDEADAEVAVSTAHKSKGREWDHVEIGPDFREPREDKETGRVKLDKDELMLAYVALTRGRISTARNSLDWIDAYEADRGIERPQTAPAAPAKPVAPATPAPAPEPATDEDEAWASDLTRGPYLSEAMKGQQAERKTLEEIDADTAAPLSLLVEGRIIWRRTSNLREAMVRAWVPCHDGQSVRVPAGVAGAMVRCRSNGCERAYALDLVDEGDGGWAARWEVAPFVRIYDTVTRWGNQP